MDLNDALGFFSFNQGVYGIGFVFTAANGDQLIGDDDAETRPAGPGMVSFLVSLRSISTP